MFRRLTGAITAAALVTTGLVAGSTVAANAESVLTVPSHPSADATVTATADSDTYPYLQVKLTRRGMVTAPYPSMTAIPTPPVPNTGGPVDVVVPTWGIGEADPATFALLGCTASAPDTCTSLLATQDRYIQQIETVGVVFDRPGSGPLLVPTEKLHVFPYGSTGGRVTALVDGTRMDIGYGSTDLTSMLDNPLPDGRNLGSTEIKVQRCSAVIRDETFCEAVAGETTVDFLRRIAPVNATTPPRPFTMDPTWSSSSQTWEVQTETLGADYTLTWELRDPATDRVLVEPQDVTPTPSSVQRDAVISPADNVSSLPDGTYDVVLTATVEGTNGARLVGSSATGIEIVQDPPQDGLQLRDADRIVRLLGPGEIRAAHFLVDALDYGEPAELVLRDSGGVEVLHQDVDDPDFCAECANRVGYDFELNPYGDDNRLLPYGTYTARLRVEDSWGRPVEVPLGEVHFQDKRTRSARATAHPAKVRVPGTRRVGRCSTLRTPDPAGVPGSLWFHSMSRCSSKKGDNDLAQQMLRVRLPEPSGDVANIVGVNVFYRAWGRGPGVAQAACTLREIPWYGERVPRSLRWRHLCGASLWKRWEDVGKFARMRFRVTNGERLDLRRVRVVVEYEEWYTPR